VAGKFKIIVSDLHLGAGFAEEGNALEDFTQDAKFAQFLKEAREESDAESMECELILDGDIMEFLQVPSLHEFDPAKAYPPEDYRSSSEEDSIKKVNLIIAGHSVFFAALRDFLNAAHPLRRATIIKGNHDVNLHWMAVQDRIRKAVGATGERRALLTFEERYVSREGIYVEHGNQYAEKVNRFHNFEEPHDPACEDQLVLVPGSRFVIDFFNDVERERYWIDGVKPITSLIWYGFAFDFAFAVKALVGFVKAALPLLFSSLTLKETPTPSKTDKPGRTLEDLRDVQDLGIRKASAVTLARREVAKVRSALHQAAEAKSREEGARVVVFGHTHVALSEPLETGGLYINTGTWVWLRDFSDEDDVTWRELFDHPERFTEDRHLTYARIDYDEEAQPRGQLVELNKTPSAEAPG
jgi:UDP-2,3-diacylglucosamine pyrophosphatase LpxH